MVWSAQYREMTISQTCSKASFFFERLAENQKERHKNEINIKINANHKCVTDCRV